MQVQWVGKRYRSPTGPPLRHHSNCLALAGDLPAIASARGGTKVDTMLSTPGSRLKGLPTQLRAAMMATLAKAMTENAMPVPTCMAWHGSVGATGSEDGTLGLGALVGGLGSSRPSAASVQPAEGLVGCRPAQPVVKHCCQLAAPADLPRPKAWQT